MKILYVLDRPNLYGSEQHILKLLRIFMSVHQVYVLVFNDGPLINLIKAEGIEVVKIEIGWNPGFQLRKLISYLKFGKFDIIHAHQPKALLWASIAGCISNIPCIITIHSLPSSNYQTYNNILKKIAVGAFHYAVKWIAEIFATQVLYLSNFSFKQALIKGKSSIIPNWIENSINPDFLKLKFSEEKKLISVGSVTYNKGMDRMIVALSKVSTEKWSLKIVGGYDLNYKEKLMLTAEGYGIGDRIEFLGHVDNVQDLLLESDGFVLLSRGETFGLAYIEAMNCGLPVVAWDIPVTEQIIPEGNVILNREEEIKQLFSRVYQTQEYYRKVVLNNSRFVKENFTVNKVKTRYINLYDKVLFDSRG